jgi:hypothetical protein
MAIVLRSDLHWPNGLPRKHYHQDGTRKAATPQSPAKKRQGPAARMVQQIERHGAAARVVNAIARPKGAAGKALAPIPEHRKCHPSLLLRDESRRDFDALYRWAKAADAAPGTFSAQQRQQRAEVQKRVDLLRGFVWA